MNRSIKAATLSLTSFFLCTLVMATISLADAPSYGMPQTINTSAKYLFFLHNYYVETKGPDGDCDYYGILKAFTDKGFIVVSELRPKDASVIEYAKKATVNIQKLLDAGVTPKNITVAGHSKGAVIGLQIASLLGNPNVNYVIMAGCGISTMEKAYPDFSILKGNFISVYAISDKVAGSCTPAFSQAKQDVFSTEITLDSEAGHQLFFKPADIWLEPVMSWLTK
ncbi:MAG: hypothetical protein V2B20_10475 [Pseudomonadota bacterium]